MKNLLYILILLPVVNLAQVTSTSIDSVKVYLSGASISRTATINLSKGTNTVILENVSPDINENSIKVSNLNGVALSSLQFSVDFLKEKSATDKQLNLENRRDSVASALNLIDSEIAGLDEEKALIQSNRNLNNKDTGITLAQIKAFGSYYNSRITTILTERSSLTKQRLKVIALQDRINEEISKSDVLSNTQSGVITLKMVSASSKIKTISLQYNVNDAGWSPFYDIKGNGDKDYLDIAFKGQVYQNSGIDWNGVKISLSTSDPNTDNSKPELGKKELNFIRYASRKNAVSRRKPYNPNVTTVRGKVTDGDGEPLFGTTIIEKGTSNAVTTDFDGNYSINVTEKMLSYSYSGYDNQDITIYSSIMNVTMDTSLEAVVLMGYRNAASQKITASDEEVIQEEIVLTTTVEDNFVDREYLLDGTYSIISGDGSSTDMPVENYQVNTDYEYYTAPVINENVYLTAGLKDWESLQLIPGDATVYFDNTYLGSIYFDTDTTQDELIVGLGIDPLISVKREDKRDYKARSIFGTNRIVKKEYLITVKNNRKNAVSIKLEDRIPVSSNSKIKVSDVDYNDATLDEDKNILSWLLNLDSGNQVSKSLSYEVKYPRKRRINLD